MINYVDAYPIPQAYKSLLLSYVEQKW